jgi:hypothetical protein
MTLDQFIAKKPSELRLGQWFVNCYWRGTDIDSQRLYQLDSMRAVMYITGLMMHWQWDSLPDVDKKGNTI